MPRRRPSTSFRRPHRALRSRGALAAAAFSGALLLGAPGFAAEPPADGCAKIADGLKRLECFDKAAGHVPPPSKEGSPGNSAVAVCEGFCKSTQREFAHKTLSLSEEWKLGNHEQNDSWNIDPYRTNYIMLRRFNRMNEAPYGQLLTSSTGESGHLQLEELKIQVSLKTRLVAIQSLDSALWFGFTQQGNWQIFNASLSRPFRESNYEPELIWVTNLGKELWGGWNARMLMLGGVHQSNGQSRDISRSWNRIYAGAGFDKGPVSVVARAWMRTSDARGEDRNPDIKEYMGRGDVNWMVRGEGQRFTGMLRSNLQRHDHRGAIELGWHLSVWKNSPLGGYVQLFSGYGDSMIAYNFKQTVIGIGLSAFQWN